MVVANFTHLRIAAAGLSVVLLGSTCTSGPQPDAPAGYDSELYAEGMGSISGIAIGPDSLVYAADYERGRVYRVEADGAVTRVAEDIPQANGVAFTSAGRMFVASRADDAVYEVVNGNARLFVNLGDGAAPTSVAAHENTLYVSNSGDGTIVRMDMEGDTTVVLSGFSRPNGPCGLSFDSDGRMYFVDNLTGGVYSYDFEQPPRLLGAVTSLGGTYTAIGFDDRVFVTDVQIGSLIWLTTGAGSEVFASGFDGNANPPAIGPNGIAYNGHRKLYVASADAIFLITRNK